MQTRTTAIRLLEKRLFVTFITTLFILAGLYSYFLVSSVVNVIVREDIEQEIASLGSRLSGMEFAYIEKQQSIDIVLAHTLGFSAVSEKQFAKRHGGGQGLTLNGISEQ